MCDAKAHDCNGQVISVDDRVYSTQSYRFGEVIKGRVVSVIEPGMIEVLHQIGKDEGRVFRCVSRLWSAEPTEDGPLPRTVRKTCPCCKGVGQVVDVVFPLGEG